LPDESAQAVLEAVAAPAVATVGEVPLVLGALELVEDAVEVRLHDLLALRARVELEADAHRASSPTACSASSRLKIRRPRWSRDITVPIGMSRIWAASW